MGSGAHSDRHDCSFRETAFSSIRSRTAAFHLPMSLTFGLPRIRKAAKDPIHYRDNERPRPAKRDPLIYEDLRRCAEGLGQAFGKGSGSARPKSDRTRPRPRPRPDNSGEREPGFTPPRFERDRPRRDAHGRFIVDIQEKKQVSRVESRESRSRNEPRNRRPGFPLSILEFRLSNLAFRAHHGKRNGRGVTGSWLTVSSLFL